MRPAFNPLGKGVQLWNATMHNVSERRSSLHHRACWQARHQLHKKLAGMLAAAEPRGTLSKPNRSLPPAWHSTALVYLHRRDLRGMYHLFAGHANGPPLQRLRLKAVAILVVNLQGPPWRWV